MVTPLVVLYDTFFARLFLHEPSTQGVFEENIVRQSKFFTGFINVMVRNVQTDSFFKAPAMIVVRV